MVPFYYRYIWLPCALARLYLRRARRMLLFQASIRGSVGMWGVIVAGSYLAGSLHGGHQFELASAQSAPAVNQPAPAVSAPAVAIAEPQPAPEPAPEPAPAPEPEAARAPEPLPPPPPPPPPPPVVRASARDAHPNTYTYGHCTYYVASRRDVPSSWGNANTWLPRAQAMGWQTGYAPAVGAIAWTSAGALGHVAYVERVSGDQVYISEMNYAGNWNIRTERWAPASAFRYIY